MAMPKARQLKSGNWNIQITIDGERVSITRHTKKEAEAEANFRMALTETGRATAKNPYESMTTKEIMEAYIKTNEYRLSPMSIQGYNNIIRNRFKVAMNRPWNTINWERVIANELNDYSVKTVMVSWGVIKAAANQFGLNTNQFKIKKPHEQKVEHTFLTQEQMNKFQRIIYGNDLELACLLGLLSLRKNEIYGLRRKDVDIKNGFIHVCHTRTVSEFGGGFIEQDCPKTTKSNRRIPLILNPRITEIVQEMDCKPNDYLVTYAKNALYHYINKVCKENGLPLVGVHGLRHTFASVCWAKGVPMEVCMLYGGWSTDKTVRAVYQHLDDQVVTKHTLKLAEAFSLDFDKFQNNESLF